MTSHTGFYLRNRHQLRFLCLLLIFFVVFSRPVGVSGQEVRARTRPKIGLALSGGSARGFAHIGVLEWFEAHHIPIDYLSGTSMGGLVGGCYATGMSTQEMRALIEGVDWQKALSGEPPFETLTYRRKEDRRAIPTKIEVGLRKGINLPSGLDAIQPVGMILSRISYPYSAIPNFDALPTPFRCVAVDLETGKAVTLKDGSLVTALRATMAIPAVFTPIEREGRLLADGGILDNIPTDAVKEMGADIIIAVDISLPLQDRASLKTFVSVLQRTADISGLENERRSLQLADIVIAPDLTGMSSTDFDRVGVFAERGFAGAEKRSALLSKFALNDEEWKAYVAARKSRRREKEFTPDFVKIDGVGKRGAAAINETLSIYSGSPFLPPFLEDDLTLLTGQGRYESTLYEKGSNNGKDGLLVHVEEKSYGPPFAKFGLEVNGADTSNIQFNLAGRLIGLDVGRYGAETRTDVRVGSQNEAAIEYYLPMSQHGWFVAPRAFSLAQFINSYKGNSRQAVFNTRSTGLAFDVGYAPGPLSEYRLGYEISHFDSSIQTGVSNLGRLSGPLSAVSLRWNFDGQDSPIIPTRGGRYTVATHYYFAAPHANSSYPDAELRYSQFSPAGMQGTRFVIAGAGTSFGSHGSVSQQFTLGGPFRLSAFGQQQFRGDNYLLVTTGYLRKISQLLPQIGGKVMIGGWYEVGSTFGSLSQSHFSQDIAVGFIAETLIGPVAFGGSFGDQGNARLFFSIGSLF